LAICKHTDRGAKIRGALHAVTFHFFLKVELKVTIDQATKAHRGSRGIALLFP